MMMDNRMTTTLHIDWQGPGYYRRCQLFQGEYPNGIVRVRDGWRWDKTGRGAPFAYFAECLFDLIKREMDYLGVQ